MATVRVRKRGKTYSYIFEAGKTTDGKRRVIEKGGFALKDDAYAAGVAAYTDYRHGNIGITSDRITLRAFCQKWMENVVRSNVRESTYDVYSRILEQHILSVIGMTDLQDITPALLDGFIRQQASLGLSHSYLLQMRRILHQALDYAVYPAELIQSNPVNYIKIPKSAPRNLVKRTIIAPDVYEQLLRDHPLGKLCHIPIMLLYHTGARIGEVLGLCWENVDFERRVICIRQQYTYISGSGNLLVPPKTPTSIRDIIVDESLLAELKRWKAMQSSWELEAGDTYRIVDEQDDHTLRYPSKRAARPDAHRRYMVCTGPTGKPLSRATLMQTLKKYDLNAHSFRHTHATMLIEAGASLKGVAGRLGHKRVEMTDEVYTHNTKKIQQDTEKAFEKTLENMQTKS